MRSLPSLPIVARFRAEIDGGARREIERIIGRVRQSEPALGDLHPFGREVQVGLGEMPTLVLGDRAYLGRWQRPGPWALEYRAHLLAGTGDFVALGLPRHLPYERYLREVLAFGSPEVLTPRPAPPPAFVATRCALDPAVRAALVARARAHGGLNILPYVGSGDAWALAGLLAEESGVPIGVGAPPPRLTRRVNDKLWFSRRVQELLGHDALPPTHFAFGPAALAGRVARLARRHEFVCVKLTESGGATGNLVLESAGIRALAPRALRDRLIRLLGQHRWQGGYPVLVSVWECPVIVSPSVQIWIPLADEGTPVVEGIFDQSVMGLEGEFIGAAPTTLPLAWQRRLAQEGALLATLFQGLGYYGRCSLDALLVGEGVESAVLHWVECNARWGGTSIPLTVVNRLVDEGVSAPFVIVQRAELELPKRPFDWLLNALEKRLFRPRVRDSGVVLLGPAAPEAGTGFQFAAIAPTLEEARREAAELNAWFLDPSVGP